MNTAALKFLFLFVVCSSGVFSYPINDHQTEEQIFHSSRIELATNPVTVTVPPDTSSPGIVTVNPTPSSTPVTVTPTTPITNPTNPVPTGGTPPVSTNAPAAPGQSWCVARGGAPQTSIQKALDYACGIGRADCSAIQQGASCYNPNTLQNHASYAFNSYYQKNPVQTSCDFGGTAVLTNVNPSSGSCIFPTSSSSSTTPTTQTPATASSSTGVTPTGSGSLPTLLNSSSPALGGATTGFGDIPPTFNNSSVSISSSLQPFISCILVVMSVITGEFILDV